MLNFDINDSLYRYSIKEIPIDAIITDKKNFKEKFGKEKLEYFNEKFSASKKNLTCFKGIYIFVINKEDNLKLDEDFFQETYMYKKTSEGEYEYIRTISSSYRPTPVRKPGDGEVTLENAKVFYCGRSDEIFSRTKEHLTSKSYSGTMSLKLGFDNRKWVREYLKCYILLIDDNSRADVEKYIHDTYESYFGDY